MDLSRGAIASGEVALAPTPSLPPAPSGDALWRSAAGGVVLLAFLLRMVNLGGQSLWYDEAFSLLLARQPLGEIPGRTALDTMPPLFYWLLHLWGVGPPVDFYPRFLSVLAGVLSVALVWAVAQRLSDGPVAAAAALYTAVSPYHLYYSQEVRMYALLGLWSLLAVYGFLRGWQRGEGAGWALYGAGTALALYTHALGWLPSASLLFWAVLQARRRSARLQAPLLALLAGLALYLPWMVVLVGQTQQVLASFWYSPPSFLSPLASFYLFFAGTFPGPVLLPLGLGAVLLALALTAAAGFRRRVAWLGLLWVWALLPLLALLAASLLRPLYLERVALGAAFPVYILLGWATLRTHPRWLGWALGGVLLVVGAWGLGHWYGEPAYGKPPQREAAQVLLRQWQPGEPVLHTSDGSLLPFLLYAPELPNRLLLGDPEYFQRTARARSTYEALAVSPLTPEEALAGAQRFFLVVALDHSVEYQRAVAEAFDRAYRRLGEEDVRGIIVRTYQKR
ncbi:MAG: glycosyltransferase family 39 protein [Chloroflexi bacterium]|nr:glycosyltransferase family 39 protein [Chloroflexota bacterium]